MQIMLIITVMINHKEACKGIFVSNSLIAKLIDLWKECQFIYLSVFISFLIILIFHTSLLTLPLEYATFHFPTHIVYLCERYTFESLTPLHHSTPLIITYSHLIHFMDL